MASSGTGRGARIARQAPQPEDVAVGSHSNKRDTRGALVTLGSQAAPSSGGATLTALQGTAGNGAVARFLRSRHQAIPRGLQAKLMVGAANDPLEREADRVADLVMRMGLSRSASGRADEVDEAPIQRLADPGQDPASAFEADTAVASRLTARRGGGQPLPPAVRNRMEAGFGADFSEVRIHRDAEASDLSTGLAARAFTHGADIYFAAGAYEPGSRSGQHLLAHELTHVMQQGSRGVVTRQVLTVQRQNGKKSAGAKGARDQTLQRACSGFAVDFATRRIDTMSPRTPLPKGAAVQVFTVGDEPEQAKDRGGKPFGWVLCSYNQRLLAVEPDAVLDPMNKHLKRLKQAAAVAKFAEATNEATEGAGTGLRLEAKGEAKALSKDIAQVTTQGKLSTAEKEVYDKANLYDPDFEAGAGSAAAVGDWFAGIESMRSFIMGWKSMPPEKRVARMFDNSGNVLKVFASTTNLIAQAQIAANKDDYKDDTGAVAQSDFGKRTVWVADGKGGLVASEEDYQATEIEKVSIVGGLFASPLDALSALKDAVKGVINWGKHLADVEEHGNLAREGVGVVHSFGKAAKAALAVAFKVKDFFQGTGASQALEVLPGMGLALNAIEIMKRSMDVHRARKDAVTVKEGKAAGKQALLERGGWDDLKKLDRHKIRARRAQLEQLRDNATFPKDRIEAEEQLAVIDEYFLDRDLLNTANKRRDRGTLAIVKECQALVGNIATLAGQAHVSLAFKLSSTATGLSAWAARKLKQGGRDLELPGFNKNKTTEKKNLRYLEIAERLYDDFVKVVAGFGPMLSASEKLAIRNASQFEKALQEKESAAFAAKDAYQVTSIVLLDEKYQRIKGRVKAAGCSWREFVAEPNPAQRFAMLVSGQKKRE